MFGYSRQSPGQLEEYFGCLLLSEDKIEIYLLAINDFRPIQ
jgi:hypothetical protein